LGFIKALRRYYLNYVSFIILGTGLFAMAVLAFGADYFAEKRGHVHMNGLKKFVGKQ
jgi:hypothetical protein